MQIRRFLDADKDERRIEGERRERVDGDAEATLVIAGGYYGHASRKMPHHLAKIRLADIHGMFSLLWCNHARPCPPVYFQLESICLLLSTWQLANGPGMGSRRTERGCDIKLPCIGMVSCGVQERSERTEAALSKGRTNDLLQDSLPQHISSRRRLWLVSLLLLAIASALVACDTGPTVERTPVPTSAPTFTATPIATMPALTSEVGWHTVLTMGDTSGARGDASAEEFHRQ